MSELAYDKNGDPFDVPDEVCGWRVRRFRNAGMKGAPEVVFGADGRPLVMDVGADAAEFRTSVGGAPGRYRLDGLDEEGRAVDGVQPSYLVLSEPVGGVRPPTSSLEQALVEVVRSNSRALEVMSEKFAGVMESTSRLLEAADGAGLPRREPMGGFEEDESDEDEGEEDEGGAARSGSDVSSVISQVMSMVSMVFGARGTDSKRVGALPEGPGTSNPAANAAEAITSEEEPTAPPGGGGKRKESRKAKAPVAAPSMDDEKAMAHLFAIQSRLEPKEQAQVQRMVKAMSVDDLVRWRDRLSALSVDDAVIAIRGELAEKGAAS